MADQTLQQAVIDELEWDPSIDAAHIGVTARDGVVTLSGRVETYAAKLAAERLAGRVSGVKAVAEELKVDYSTGAGDSDEEIARRAVRVLSWNVEVPPDKVKISVENGVVELTGELDWNYQRSAAEKAIRTLHGVKAVIDNLSIKPRATAGDIRDRIKSALTRNAQIEANGIAVNVEGGKVTLSGNVPRWADRLTAEDAAWSAAGVVEVEDRLTVA